MHGPQLLQEVRECLREAAALKLLSKSFSISLCTFSMLVGRPRSDDLAKYCADVGLLGCFTLYTKPIEARVEGDIRSCHSCGASILLLAIAKASRC
mmetsp:Transcript_29692/g.91134  ORF Transcript_29692/g.91134 Transcript_29692/m.91134 type:complete len:96 (-) Transcript_29692:226-513(-)